jgi:hypothetical protein
VKAGPGWANAAIVASIVVVGAVATGARHPSFAAPAGGAQDPEPSPVPSPIPHSQTPIADSVEPAVDRFVRALPSPCGRADPDVPCFPVSVEVQGRRYSVVESLRNLELDDRPSPSRPPTSAEMTPYRAGAPLSASGGVGFDPVCAVKGLLKKIGGKSRIYFLYRVWDQAGERALLRDRPLEPSAYDGVPGVEYELLGRFGDECEAIKAYRKVLRAARARQDQAEARAQAFVLPLPVLDDDGYSLSHGELPHRMT